MSTITDPLEIIRNLKGVANAFYLNREILEIMKKEEMTVKSGSGNIFVDNQGFNQTLERDFIIAVIKDPRFRPPPEPTVLLVTSNGDIIGTEVFPFTAKEYLSRKDVIWLSDAFVLFPGVEAKGNEKFIMPPISFPELNEEVGCKDVVSCSPAPTCDMLMRKYYELKDDSRFASVLVGFNKIQ